MKKLQTKIKKFERRLDNFNHIMELIRTIVPVMVLGIQILILFKLAD
jgi:hypothetical protein